VDKAKRELASAEVRSPLDGNLIRIYSWPGMKETDQGLALIGRTDRMQVWAQVFQTDVNRLRIGQGATVTPESGGFSGTMRAELASIIGVVSARDLFATNANNDVNARVVLVKLNLAPDDRDRVKRLSGLNVTVRFDR
jgi:HlyD family secretion protein